MDIIEQLNAIRSHPDSAEFGVTSFSDLSEDEFRQIYLTKKPSNYMAKKIMENSLKKDDIYFYPLLTKSKLIVKKNSGAGNRHTDNRKLERFKRAAVVGDNLPDKVDW